MWQMSVRPGIEVRGPAIKVGVQDSKEILDKGPKKIEGESCEVVTGGKEKSG